MITNEEKFELGVRDWSYFEDSIYNADLFIGNGFSINLCNKLSYRSLYEKFSKNCDSKVVELFNAFETSNFEFILDALKNAEIISGIYNLNYTGILSVIKNLKDGLIKTISDTHPEYKDISPDIFRSLAYEFKQFNDIYTTNYDVFLYKIILASNDLVEQKLLDAVLYQDEFCETIDKYKLGLGNAFDKRRVIYYLHGALFLYNQGQTYKFRKGGDSDEYIRMLRIEIQNGNIPLFIAEGKSKDKLNAINNNYYLRRCSEILKSKNKTNIVVYGSSFQTSDSHIIGWINKSKPENLVVSIYLEDKSSSEVENEISRISGLFGDVFVSFYDSNTLFTFSSKYKF